MTAKYFAILTNQGAARLANAAALGTKLNLTQMAVGDANGTLPTPDPAQTKLISQKRIAPLNLLTVDPTNTSQIIAEQIIPENEGGFWIREIGLYDDDGILIAVANCPETYKPQLQEGSGRTQTIRMILIVSSTSSITLKIDPSVVLATRKYADDKAIELKLYVDDLMSKHLAAADPHSQYATKDSPTFTGKPKAPTPPVVANDKQVATAEFVQAVIAALVSGELANKQPLDKTLTDLSGKDVAAVLQYLGLSDVLHKGDGRLLSGTYVSDAEDKKSIGLRASTGCQFMRAYQAPDAPSQTAYWNVVVMPESTVAGNPVSCIAISVSDIYVGHGTSAGITTWVRLSSDNAAPPIGIPFYWPLAALPDSVVPEWAGMTFLKMNGATFSATQYPKLAKVWPTLSLPETRGEFIRVADDGRGVNPGRAALSYEDDMFKSHSHSLYSSDQLLQSGSSASDVGSQYQTTGVTGNVTADSGGSETRPRNIAFYFIVRAK